MKAGINNWEPTRKEFCWCRGDNNLSKYILHSVEEVITGERLVFIGWIESYVKSIEEREYLFDLDAAARSLLTKYGSLMKLTLFLNHIRILRRLEVNYGSFYTWNRKTFLKAYN